MWASMAESVGHARGLAGRATRRLSAPFVRAHARFGGTPEETIDGQGGKPRGNPIRSSTSHPRPILT